MLSNEEIGQYMRLLCFQHQHGHFDAVAMQRLCGGNPAALVRAKFKVDENGLFFNERLDNEVIKRKTHSEKQKQNANMRWHKSGNATAMPLENENVNENESVNKIEKEKGGTGEKGLIAQNVIEYLNQLSGRKFLTTNQLYLRRIIQRLKEGYTEDELREIIEYKVAEWKGGEMEKHLQPDTLFNKEKCNKYRDQVRHAKENNLTISQIKGKRNDKSDLWERVAATYRESA